MGNSLYRFIKAFPLNCGKAFLVLDTGYLLALIVMSLLPAIPKKFGMQF